MQTGARRNADSRKRSLHIVVYPSPLIFNPANESSTVIVYVTRYSALFVSSDITLLPWLILAQTYRRLVNISLFSKLMIVQSGIHCCPVLDNFVKKGCRGALAVFGARSNRLARWRLHKQRGKHLAGTRPPRRSLALNPIPDGVNLNLCYRR
jgi:hypothetical protein